MISHQGSPRLSIQKIAQNYLFQLQLPGTPVALSAVLEVPATPFLKRIEQTADLLNQLLYQRQSSEATDSVLRQDPLLALGRLIYRQLFPPVIQQGVRQIPAGTSLLIATDSTDVPWELAHDDENYLALKYLVSRQSLLAETSRRQRVDQPLAWQALCIGNPTGDLAHAATEIEQLVKLLERIPGTAPPRILMQRRATKSRVLQELAGGSYQLIHFSGHTRYVADAPEATGLLLAGGEILTAAEIRQNLSGRPFVFLNGCESAKSDVVNHTRPNNHTKPNVATQMGEAAQSLTEAFLAAGARGCLGAFWPIRDVDTLYFTLRFYRSALQGERLSAALWRARTEAQKERPLDPLWASFSLYAHSQEKLINTRQLQRHLGTVLAVDIRGIAEQFADTHPEKAARFIEQHVIWLTEQIVHYGGQPQFVTDTFLLGIFGLSPAHQNDAERAVYTALAVTAAITEDKGQTTSKGLDTSVDNKEYDLLRFPTVDQQQSAPFALGIGISSGEIFFRGAEVEETGLQFVTGAPIHAAGELARKAAPATILLTTEVEQLVRHQFVITPWSLSAADGATIFRAVALKERHTLPLQSRSSHLVGRERELQELCDRLRQCQSGRGQVIGILGEAGMGKSLLVSALYHTTKAESFQWLMVASPSAYTPRPYELIAQFVKQLVALSPEPTDLNASGDKASVEMQQRRLRAALTQLPGKPLTANQLDEGCALLGEILQLSIDKSSLQHFTADTYKRRLVTLVGRLLTYYTTTAPCAIVLEDLQWCDEASLAILDQLLAGIERLPVLVITLFRTESTWQPPWWNRRNYRQFYLNELDVGAVHQLIATLCPGATVPSDVAAVIHSHSNGNPLFIHELVIGLREMNLLSVVNSAWHLAGEATLPQIPSSIQRVLLTRINRMSSAAQRLLSIGAVIGDTFFRGLVQELWLNTMAEPVMEQAFHEVIAKELIYQEWDDESYIFRHALVREVAYERLLTEERQNYHRHIGEVLETMEEDEELRPIEQLAHHFYWSIADTYGPTEIQIIQTADVAHYQRAVKYLLAAGRRAQQKYAGYEALQQAKRAHQIVEAMPAAGEIRNANLLAVYDALSKAYQLLANFDAAIETLHCAYTLLTESATTVEKSQYAKLVQRIGQLYIAKSEYATALEWAHRGLNQLVDYQDLDCDKASLYLLAGSAHYNRGELEQAIAQCDLALDLAKALPNDPIQAEAYNLLGITYDIQGRMAEAIDAYTSSFNSWSAVGDLYQAARVENNLGVTYLAGGNWTAAQLHLIAAEQFWERIDNQYNHAFVNLNLGMIALFQGMWTEADQRLQGALQVWQQAKNQRWMALCHTNLGLLYSEQQQWGTAQHHLDQSERLLSEQDIRDLWPEVRYTQAAVALGQGNYRQAHPLAKDAVALAVELGMRLEEGIALRILGKVETALGSFSEANAHLQASLAILRSIHNRYESGRTLVALAELQKVQDGESTANPFRQQAQKIFQEIGALADLQKLHNL